MKTRFILFFCLGICPNPRKIVDFSTIRGGQERANGRGLSPVDQANVVSDKNHILWPIHTARHDTTRPSSSVVSGGVNWLLRGGVATTPHACTPVYLYLYASTAAR